MAEQELLYALAQLYGGELDDPARALALTDWFMHKVVAVLDNAWQLTSEEIEVALRNAQG